MNALFATLLLGAATISPTRVPAQGPSEALLKVGAPGMVRVRSTGLVGVTCALVDRVRGPFATGGEAGHIACDLTELLDAGTYKLRLSGPKKAAGEVGLEANEFPESQRPLVRLDRGQSVDATLAPGRQASFWIRVRDPHRALNLRITGRTAGRVALWRQGRWLEAHPFTDFAPSPRSGQPVHDWWLSRLVEPGVYRLVVYGTDVERWANGRESDLLRVSRGFEAAPPTGFTSVALSPFGSAVRALPNRPTFAMASLSTAPAAPVHLALRSQANDGTVDFGEAGSCDTAPKALDPACVATAWSSVAKLLVLTGPPGTRVDLTFARANNGGEAEDGDFGFSGDVTFLAKAGGDYLVGLTELPPDEDSAPLGCVLQDQATGKRIASDLPEVSPVEPLVRSFNSAGDRDELWFHVASPMTIQVLTDSARHASCALFELGASGLDQRINASLSSACGIVQSLAAGDYGLVLYQGNRGIQTVRIGAPGSPAAQTPTRSGCVMRASLTKDRAYILVTNRPAGQALRGLVARPLSVEVGRALTMTIDPRRTIEIPVASGAAFQVRSLHGAAFECGLKSDEALAKNGICEVGSRWFGHTLVLRNPGAHPVLVTLTTPWQPKRSQPQAWTPAPQPLTELVPDRPLFLDFDRNQERSLQIDVGEPGLYDVTTRGLLATRCTLRTPAILAVADDTEGGRGRNCFIAHYLRRGTYLLTITTQGRSRGRLSVLLTDHAIRQAAPLSVGDEVFSQVAADDLVQRKLVVVKGGDETISTVALGPSLSCRLDDADGWPLVAVPASCDLEQRLAPGTYLWSELPATVASRRRTRLSAVQPPVVWSGPAVRRLSLNEWATAQLDRSGRDRWQLVLQAPDAVAFQMTNRMAGRIDRVDANGAREPVGQIPPNAAGTTLKLAAGTYEIIAQHSEGDVDIRYRIFAGSDVLLPGTSRDVSLPATVTVRVPRDGTLRLGTTGDSDVRCRLRDSSGRIVAEVLDNGEDWNCALAEQLKAGDYQLEVTSQTNTGGSTRITAAMPLIESAGAIHDGQQLRVAQSVIVADVPPAAAGVVQQVSFASTDAFSCAMVGDSGAVLRQSLNVTRCDFLLRSKERHRVRLWTLGAPAKLRTILRTKPIRPFAGGRLGSRSAGRAMVARPGRYETGMDAFCLTDAQRGLLKPCGPDVSLEPGPTIFASAQGAGPIALREIVVSDAVTATQRTVASMTPFIEAQRSRSPAVHLLAVTRLAGEATAPTCGIDGGARVLTASGCFAASGLSPSAVARWSAPTDRSVAVNVTRLAAVPPAHTRALRPGVQQLSWTAPTGRFSLPLSPVEIDLVLPQRSWAVQLDRSHRAVDLCPPASAMSRCVLSGAGGELVLWSSRDAHAEATLLTGASASPPTPLSQAYEELVPARGTRDFAIAASDTPRTLEVTGATSCAVTMPNGDRLRGCHTAIPARSKATLAVEVMPGPVRVVLASDEQQRFGFGPLPPGAGTILTGAQGVALSSPLTNRSFHLDRDALVHVRADRGVCALAQDATVLAVSATGDRCAIDRFLTAGAYRILIRPFGAQPLSGRLSWTSEPVGALSEGVGPVTWIGPGETRLFRFTTASAGHVGLGLREPSETLDCVVLDGAQRSLGTGCQLYLQLATGTYFLSVHASARAEPQRFRPVLFGLAGAKRGVPASYLREFFQRIGETP